MSGDSKIEWTDATWNPTTGCDRVSPGCDHCYAMTLAPRLKAMGSAHYQRDGDPRTSGPGFGVSTHDDALDWPLRKTKPLRIFVNSMSDLFHAEIPDAFIAQVFAVISLAPRHTFQVLTKRHGRMRSLLNSAEWHHQLRVAVHNMLGQRIKDYRSGVLPASWTWPLPNVWVGVSVENQQWADIRIPALLQTPAAVRFLSCEPLLGSVDLRGRVAFPSVDAPRLHWVIAGGESGHEARPMHPDWARSLRDQCTAAGVAFHFKQWGEWAPHRLDGGAHANVAMSKTRWQYESDRFTPDGARYVASEPDGYSQPGMTTMLRVGKRKAGRELDGRTWDQFPQAVSA